MLPTTFSLSTEAGKDLIAGRPNSISLFPNHFDDVLTEKWIYDLYTENESECGWLFAGGEISLIFCNHRDDDYKKNNRGGGKREISFSAFLSSFSMSSKFCPFLFYVFFCPHRRRGGVTGAYECQVSTTPIRSHVLHLKVAGEWKRKVTRFQQLSLFCPTQQQKTFFRALTLDGETTFTLEPLITLSGAPELHIKHGSRINLTCQIDNYPKSIYYLTWYKDGKVRSCY